MKGKSLAEQVLPSIKKGDCEKVTEFFDNGLTAAEHYIRTGDLILMMPAEEDIAASIMYGQENMDQLVETLQYAKELLEEKLDPEQFETYIKIVAIWLLKNKSKIRAVIKAGFKRSVGSKL